MPPKTGCNCGPTAKCVTARCACNGGNCANVRCECNPDVCENRRNHAAATAAAPRPKQSSGCECGPTSMCKTQLCACVKAGGLCSASRCGCNSAACTNNAAASSSLSSSTATRKTVDVTPTVLPAKQQQQASGAQLYARAGPIVTTYDHPTINNLASDVTSDLHVSVYDRRDAVIAFRGGIDMYTREKGAKLESPEVDHIVEVQVMGHATARALREERRARAQGILTPLKGALNMDMLHNYNVTSKSINSSKGQIHKNFLLDGIRNGQTIRSQAITMEAKAENYLGEISRAICNSFPHVYTAVADARRADGHVTGGNDFGAIANELEVIFKAMDVEDDDSGRRKTRTAAAKKK